MSFSAKAVVLVLSAAVCLSQAVEVSTPNGVIIGSNHLRSRHGKIIYSFMGIPYAQPPVGKLRFKESQPVTPWKNPINATQKCSACPQTRLFFIPKGENPNYGQEDCLCLNVYSPSLGKGAKLPVMFYIHSGAYKMFSSMAEPEFLVGEVVLVDLNYRLGALGFSTTGDGIIPGNLGLKDQLLALKWVQENIENFGGDPNRVTVFGNSAGGASTHLILLSPRSKGLVHRGISMSGTATCPWALLPQQVVAERTKALGVLCGCPPEPSEKLLECLQNLPLRNILDSAKVFSDDRDLPLTAFAPVVESPGAENALITKHPDEISSTIPWMTGLTSSETLGLPARFMSDVGRNNLDIEEQFDLMIPKFLALDSRFAKDEIPSVVNRLKKFYFGDEPVTKDNIYKMDALVSDGWFLKGVVESTSHYKGTTYLYYYDYLQSNASFSDITGHSATNKGVSHMDDLLSIFPMSMFFPNRTLTKKDVQVSEKMVHLWTSFAKHGDLTKNTLTKWEPLDKNSLVHTYLYINATELKQMKNLLGERARFWATLEDYSRLV